MEVDKSIIGKRIKELRKKIDLTQEELAVKLGLNNKSSISQYEKGIILPSDDIKLKMCEIFSCSLDFLMGKSDIKTPENETKIKDIYMHLAKEAQDLNLDKDDVDFILDFYKKHKK